ncbi:MAG: hypothetical protein L0Z47_06030 [Actinobacteria bacterium]|nr:hypothetical protein [Actinomycetota bacterium]
MDVEILATMSGALLVWVATVHLVLALGVRRGELVWSGRYPRLLPRPLRWRSLGYAAALIGSAWLLAGLAGVLDTGPLADRWARSTGFVLTVFLGLAGLASLLKGSRWERLFFAPFTLFGAGLSCWLTFF